MFGVFMQCDQCFAEVRALLGGCLVAWPPELPPGWMWLTRTSNGDPRVLCATCASVRTQGGSTPLDAAATKNELT